MRYNLFFLSVVLLFTKPVSYWGVKILKSSASRQNIGK